jgi:Fic family protein
MKKVPLNRVGGTIRQSTGYDAYIPNRLYPDGPELQFDPELFKLISEAERALGELKSIQNFLPDKDLFISSFIKKEALLSSQIEGTESSLDEVMEADEDLSFEAKPVEEVFNYIRAMNHGLNKLHEIPFSIRLIKEIHLLLMQGVRGQEKSPGEFKKTQNWIGPGGCTLNEAVFIPAPPSDTINLMGDLEKYYHADEKYPVLIKAAILHAHFETIHPFADGNGRIGRLLITFFLCEKKILENPLLYLSLFFKENKQEYYSHLMDVRLRGNWESWIKFFLRGVRQTSLQASDTAKRLINLREKHREIINSKLIKVKYSSMIHDLLYKQPFLSFSTLHIKHGLAYPTIKRTADHMAKEGLLLVGENKNGHYLFLHEYMKVLREGTE